MTDTEYMVVKSLGQGYFGKVLLCQDKHDNQRAIKIQGAGNTFREKSRVREEYDLMFALDNPYILKAYSCTIIDNKSLINMEYINGKTLFDYLEEWLVFPEPVAKFLLSEIAVALDFLHTNKTYPIMYRDLKPENILLTKDNHIKLTDFGLIKRLYPGGKAFDICGTMDYMAPEVFIGLGYTQSVDWYSFGILTYEFLTGTTPYIIDTKHKNFRNALLTVQVDFPSTISKNIKTFIEGFVCRNPERRHSFANVIKSAWMKDVFWDDVRAQKIQCPDIMLRPRV